jgi:hypothetical protein
MKAVTENMITGLNIVTLNIPFPPDYGGMIDTYYRIRSLKELGIRIHLHCFEYGRPHSKELESICESVSYYKRDNGFIKHFSSLPYIVSTRRSGKLPEELVKNDSPVLFDGLHTTFYACHPSLSQRLKLVRLHNIEHTYYSTLADFENNPLKKLYYRTESVRLKRYEKILARTDFIMPISLKEHEYFSKKYGNSVYLPPFHPFDKPEIMPGSGRYVLLHGDLSVNINASAAVYLIQKVFSKSVHRFIIAGKNPPRSIQMHASHYRNISVIANPDNEKMTELVRNAHIIILPSLHSNGFKIKNLISLFSGRHCIIYPVAEEESITTSLCESAVSEEDLIVRIDLLMNVQFTEEMISNRSKALLENFSNSENARKLIELISGCLTQSGQ